MIKHSAPSRTNAEMSDLPIARLDAQDVEQSLPIREYLEQNGCAVIMNRKPAIAPEYHIMSGDELFVQSNLASLPEKSSKLFVVLFLGRRSSVPDSLLSSGVKIAVITGQRISTRETHELFAYFFTDDKNIYYFHTDTPPIMEVKKIEKPEIPGEVHKKTGHTIFLRFSMVVAGIVIAPIFWYLISLSMIVVAQWYGISAIRTGDTSRFEVVARVTDFWLRQGRGTLTVIGFPILYFGNESFIRSQERILSIAGDLSLAQTKAAQLITRSALVTPLLFAKPDEPRPSDVSLAVSLDTLRLELAGLTNSLELATAQLHILAGDIHVPFAKTNVKNLTNRVESQITQALTQIATIHNLLTVYRTAGGFDEKKTYLIILQNSMELRPTGGFIGSIATLGIEDGVMETPVVQDVYALDGQLKGHVDPPGPIKELLGQEHWYLRDSNWDPDFTVSGERAAWFYEKETGVAVDGVIAIATPLLTGLLDVTGPLHLPDYNDRITKENFFGKSLFYTKADFFPGSTQKKDFLGSVVVALISRLTSELTDEVPALARVVGRALASGDIQFWFPQRQTQAIIKQAGWAGEVIRPETCESSTPPCMVERVAVVESNMGVNKVNAFVKRLVKSRVDVGEDGGVDGTIALTYQNTSTDDALLSGGGVYLSYTRVYLAGDTRVGSVRIDGEEVPYSATTENGSTIIGFAFTVPPGMERTVTITYRRGVLLVFTNNESTFAVSIRKQPGMIDTNLDLAVRYPAGWNSQTATGLLANAREARYNTTLDSTKTYSITFRR